MYDYYNKSNRKQVKKKKKQFEYGVRIDFSLQSFLDLRALGVLGIHEWL